MKILKEIDASAKQEPFAATPPDLDTKIAAVTWRPGKWVGSAHMNPVPMMKLVEVISGYHTEGCVDSSGANKD